MEHIHQVTSRITEFIHHKEFFYYHGAVLAFAWFIGATIAILLRRVSKQLHALCFFIIDVVTAFFLIGAIIRVYPYLSKFQSWSIVKKGHIIGGAVFLILVLLQHVGGVTTLLKGISFNPIHRKFGVVVSSLGKFLAVGGMIIAGWQQWIIIAATVLAILMTAFGIFKHFGQPSSPKETKSASSEKMTQTARQRSPPREVKRD